MRPHDVRGIRVATRVLASGNEELRERVARSCSILAGVKRDKIWSLDLRQRVESILFQTQTPAYADRDEVFEAVLLLEPEALEKIAADILDLYGALEIYAHRHTSPD